MGAQKVVLLWAVLFVAMELAAAIDLNKEHEAGGGAGGLAGVAASSPLLIYHFETPRRLMMKGNLQLQSTAMAPTTAQAEPPTPILERRPRVNTNTTHPKKLLVTLISALAAVIGVGGVAYGIHCCQNCHDNSISISVTQREGEGDEAQAPAAPAPAPAPAEQKE